MPITTFRKLLLTVCQHEFDNRESYFQDLCNAKCVDEKAATATENNKDEARMLAKKKMLGNVKFIGELGRLDLLNEARLHKCIKTLLEKRKDEKYSDMSDDLECFCKMIPSIGLKLDQGEAVKLMDQYFDRIKKLQSIKDILPRIRFLLQDVVELRINKWIPRQTQLDNAPKTMKEVRRGTEFDEPSNSIGEAHNLNINMNNQAYGPMYHPYNMPPHMFNFPPPPHGMPHPFNMPPPSLAQMMDPGFGSSFYNQKQYPSYNGNMQAKSAASTPTVVQSINNNDEIKSNNAMNQREKLNSSSSSSSSYSSTNSYNNNSSINNAKEHQEKVDNLQFSENNKINGKELGLVYFY